MKKLMAIACVLGLLAGTRGLAGDVEKAEAAIKGMIKLMKDATAVMKTMTDADSIKAAAPKIEKLTEKRKEVFKELETTGNKLSKEEKGEIRKKFGEEVQAAQKAFGVEVKRVQALDGGKDALKPLLQGGGSKPKKEKDK